MNAPYEATVSLWMDTTAGTDYPPLRGTVEADVAVVGAGITGLTTALLLKRAGLRVAVVEAARVAAGATGYTTAKVTSQHGPIYRDLIERFDEDRARGYAEANQAALEQVARLVEELHIGCDFHRAAAHLYTEDASRVDGLRAEAEACQRLGLPASFVDTLDLPYPVSGAVRFEHQARFHPRKYCLALAAAIPGDGSHLFEGSRVTDVTEDSPCEVVTAGGTVRAQRVVLATQIPILDRCGFFTRTWPSRSYVIAARVTGHLPHDVYLSVDEPTRSVRTQEVGPDTLLLIGGEGHKVGQDDDTRQRYAALEAWTRERFPVQEIAYRWSAQDYMPIDDLPYIGPITFASDRVYVATGYRKWGMTTATVAATILGEQVQGRTHPWADVFDSTRVNVMQSAKQFVTANADVAKELVSGRAGLLTLPEPASLAPGEGGVVQVDGEAVAAWRDDAGRLHAVSATCTHMGCVLNWNTAERSWDCPCHGSRFGYDGGVIQGPAVRNLARKAVPAR